MPLPVMLGASLATTALILYAIGIMTTVITGTVKPRNVIMQSIAVVCDAVATVCMIIQAGDITPADFHGWIGYSALALMAVDLVFVVRHRKDGATSVPMRVYAAAALAFWLVSYSFGFVKM